MRTCKISARFHSLTKMFPDRNGPRPKQPRLKWLRPNRPNQKVSYLRSQILRHVTAKMTYGLKSLTLAGSKVITVRMS